MKTLMFSQIIHPSVLHFCSVASTCTHNFLAECISWLKILPASILLCFANSCNITSFLFTWRSPLCWSQHFSNLNSCELCFSWHHFSIVMGCSNILWFVDLCLFPLGMCVTFCFVSRSSLNLHVHLHLLLLSSSLFLSLSFLAEFLSVFYLLSFLSFCLDTVSCFVNFVELGGISLACTE